MRFNALSVIFALLITTMAHQDNLPGPCTCAYCMKSTDQVKKLRPLSDSMIEACKSLHRRIDDEYQRLLAMQVAGENDSSRQFLIHKSSYNPFTTLLSGRNRPYSAPPKPPRVQTLKVCVFN